MQETLGNTTNKINYKQNLNQKSNLLSQHHRSLNPVSSTGDSNKFTLSASLQPSDKRTMKPIKGTLKFKIPIGNLLPQKRLSPDSVQHDDDFEWYFYFFPGSNN